MKLRPPLLHLSIAGLLVGKTLFAGPAQLGPEFERERQAAYAAANSAPDRAKAKEMLAALLRKAPDDGGILFRYGYVLYLDGAAAKDPRKGNALRKEARVYLEKAQKSGLDHPLIPQLLASIGPDGSEVAKQFSKVPTANDAVQKGELAFQNHDYENALLHYAEALRLDPDCFSAALFSGDVHYARKNFQAAIEYFQRAIAIDATREQAHRYWGDALASLGKPDEAGDHYIDAVIAQPGQAIPWRMLEEWARRQGLRPAHPATKIPRANVAIKNGKVELGIGSQDGTLGMAYGIVLTSFATKAIEAKQPYRHTLASETTALKAMLEIGEVLLKDPKQAKEQNVSPAMLLEIEQLKEVADAGCLEAYVFFVRADSEIAQDYAGYRSTERAKLRGYLRRFYLGLKS